MLLFVATTTMDLTNPETYSSIMAIGEDLSILIGVKQLACVMRQSNYFKFVCFLLNIVQVYMVTTKILYFHLNQSKIGSMLKELEDRFLELNHSKDPRVRRLQKYCYFQETILFFLNYFNGVMLAMSFPIQVSFSISS